MRQIHLATAMFFAPFLLAFAISSVEFAHRTWVAHPHWTSVSTRRLAAGMTDARIVAREWRGELGPIQTGDGMLKFRVMTALGTSYQVAYTIATGEATVETTRISFLTSLAFLHHSYGIWTSVTPVFSVGLLVLGVTGLFLWFKNRTERVVGVVLVAIGVGVPLGLLVSMRI
jgi:hypothetical protein